MPTVGIINYGAGNIASVIKAVDYAGADPVLVSTPDDILKADKLILPGVGAAGLAINKLREKDLEAPLRDAVFSNAKPLMGICVGMQILAKHIYEFGTHQGLGWIDADVISLSNHGVDSAPVPNMGWSDVSFKDSLSDLERELGPHKAFYFAHSFTLVTSENEQDKINSTISYDKQSIVAGISFDTVRAFQFHPEKSQVAGDILMQWFVEWNP